MPSADIRGSFNPRDVDLRAVSLSNGIIRIIACYIISYYIIWYSNMRLCPRGGAPGDGGLGHAGLAVDVRVVGLFSRSLYAY